MDGEDSRKTDSCPGHATDQSDAERAASLEQKPLPVGGTLVVKMAKDFRDSNASLESNAANNCVDNAVVRCPAASTSCSTGAASATGDRTTERPGRNEAGPGRTKVDRQDLRALLNSELCTPIVKMHGGLSQDFHRYTVQECFDLKSTQRTNVNNGMGLQVLCPQPTCPVHNKHQQRKHET